MQAPLKIAVLISGNGSNLQALISAIDSGLSAEIVVVVSNRSDAYGLQRAEQANIPTVVLDHHHFHDRESFDRELLQCLQPYAPDLIVLAGFMRILSPVMIQAFPNQIINIHPSLLPKYPGLHTHRQVLDNGDRIHGASIHVVTEGLDSGPVIAQASVTVATTDDEMALQRKVHAVEHQLYPYVIDLIACKRLQLHPNCITLDGDPLPPQGFHYACQEYENDGQI